MPGNLTSAMYIPHVILVYLSILLKLCTFVAERLRIMLNVNLFMYIKIYKCYDQSLNYV